MKESYSIIRDTREKPGEGWIFEPNGMCLGTVIEKLDTGDYSVRGMEKVVVVERKATTAELAQNVYEVRFMNELQRLHDEIKHPFVVFEFTVEQMLSFPFKSGIPERLWPKLRINAKFLAKRIAQWELEYKTKFIFAGTKGKEITHYILRNAIEHETS